MPAELSRWAEAMRGEIASMDDREALSWAAGCLRAAHAARLRALYLLDSTVIRATGVLLMALRVFDVMLPTLMTSAYKLGALATTEALGRATPGDDYQRLVPLMEAIPLWLHLLAILAGCAYLVAMWRVLKRHRSAGIALLLGVAVELAATVFGRSVAAGVGVTVVASPSIIATIVLPVVLPLLLAAAVWTGSRGGSLRAAAGALFVVGVASCIESRAGAQMPAFDAADVHASLAPVTQPMRGGVPRGGRYELRNATMVELIRTAYNVDADKVLGGPTWLELDRFDVIGKVPDAATRESVRPLLQALLVDRFGLVARPGSTSVPGTALTAADGAHKLRPATGGPADCQTQQSQPGAPVLTATCRNTTMAALADLLTQVGRGVFVGRVVDATGLQGTWDFELSWTPPAALPQAGAAGIPIARAITQQLGLQIQQRNVSASGVVVDRVNRTPTPNAPGIETRIPRAPAVEFEVAQIRPSVDGAVPSTRMMPNGQIVAVANSIKTLISAGWDVSDQSLIVGPDWMNTARFDLIARLSSAPENPQQIDNDAIRGMMRALLVQRFRIMWHTEERQLPALTLTTTGAHKLTPADPTVRSRCFDGPLPGARDPRAANAALSRVTTCQNMTMSEFAERLQGIGWGGYVQAPVADATGIEGRWTFTLAFSPIGMVQAGPGASLSPSVASDRVPAAIEPNGALSLKEAVERQLGLKLEQRERPVPVLVIDQISQPAPD
jgi:uncharacterized protein (TIGR03435 family)